MRACLRALAARRFLLPILVIICVHSLNYAQDSAYYWNPAPLGIGSTLPTGLIDAVTTPGSRIFTTNATGFGAASPASESLLFASIPSSPTGLIEWTTPDPSGGAMTSGSVAGVMLRFTENSSSGSPFVFAGVRQGTSGVELRWRVTQDGEVKVVAGAINGADFPAASRLKLEFIQGRVFLSYKKSSDGSTDPWRKRLAVEITGTGNVYSGLVLATGGSGSATLTVSNSDVRVVPARGGLPWVRLIEPHSTLTPVDRLSMMGSAFESEDWSGASVLSVANGPGEQHYSGGDYWKWQRDAADWIADPDLEDRVTAIFGEIFPSVSEGELDLYIRCGPVTSQTALPSVDSLIWDSTSVLNNHPVTGLVGDGLWIYLTSLPEPVYSDPILELTMGWMFASSPSGLKNEGSLDGLLLVGQESHSDSNGDGLPDDFGGVFAPWLTDDGDFDGDGYSNYEEYVLGQSPLLSETFVAPTISVLTPSTTPWKLARGRWSRQPAELKAVYPGTSPPVPVKGYGLYLSTLENTIGFGPSQNTAAWKGNYLTTTDTLGVARAHVWLDAECPTPVGSSSAGLVVSIRDSSVSFKVRPYDNLPPGPVDVIASEKRWAPANSHNLSSVPTVFGEWLAENGGGVWLKKWDPVALEWRFAQSIWPASNTSWVAISGDTLVSEGWVDGLGTRIRSLVLDAESGLWQSWGSTFASPVPTLVVPPSPNPYLPHPQNYEWIRQLGGAVGSFNPVIALSESWLAIGHPIWGGSVDMYEKGLTGWVLRSTLFPSSGKHTDLFGYSLAFSEDGSRLVVGAPGDAANHAAGLYEMLYLPGILRTVEHIEDIYDWVPDENGNPVWQVVGQNIWYEDIGDMTSAYPPPSAQPSAYVFERDSNDDWNQVARLVSPTIGPSVTYDLEMFGASVATVGDWVVVGAPYYNGGVNIPSSEPDPKGGVYGFKHNGTAWVQQDVELRSNPRFGENLSRSGGHVAALTPSSSHPVSQMGLPGYVAVLRLTDTSLEPAGEIVNAVGTPWLAADESTLILKTSATTAQEYQWLPAVPWDATEGTTKVGWLTVTDEDLANANASLEQITLLAGDSPRWLLDTSLSQPGAPAHEAWQSEPKALKVKLGADLESFAPGIDWLEVTALDRAGDAYTEYLGIRVTGQAPSVPVLQSVRGAGGRQVRVAWSASSHSPATYVVETADHAVIEDLLNNGGTPQQISDAFSERARVMGSQTSYYHQVATPGDVYTLKLAFRVRALNEEGISDPSNYIIANLDEDDDGLPDWWEALHGGDLDPTLDDDSDGLTNLQEYAAGTNPLVADSDGDGTLDGADSEPLNARVNSLSFVLFTPVE